MRTSAIWRAVWLDDSISDDLSDEVKHVKGLQSNGCGGSAGSDYDEYIGEAERLLGSLSDSTETLQECLDAREERDGGLEAGNICESDQEVTSTSDLKDENGNYPTQIRGTTEMTPTSPRSRPLIAKPVLPGIVYHNGKRKVSSREPVKLVNLFI